MTTLSRRAFLKALGISAAATAAPWGVLQALASGSASGPQAALWGRALEAVPVTDRWGRTAGTLLPDAVTPLEPLDATLVKLPDGYAARRSFQPLALAAGWAAPLVAGWVQVAAPYAALRRWCAPDAPLVARPGWGAVLFASERLTVDGLDWLGLGAAEGDVIGWSLAETWTPAGIDTPPGSDAWLVVEREQRQIRVLRDETVLWAAGAALPADLTAGDYALTGRSPTDSTAQTGAPWAIDFGAWRIHGAYWHNCFSAADDPSPSGVVELPVLAARALYSLPVRAARVV